MKNSNIGFSLIGATNHSKTEREKNDYYATPKEATVAILENIKKSENVFEPCVGGGHIANELYEYYDKVYCSDIINRGHFDTNVCSFFDFQNMPLSNCDIITNPPYSMALDFVKHGYKILQDGCTMAMLLRLNFLEGQKRGAFFQKHPPNRVLVFSKRVTCAMNGDFEKYKSGAQAYAWFVWEKGNEEKTYIEWI